ncbi:MAG: carboxypeptidase-like regulatory domain-containing protein [Gemmatimonadales bacterium]
MAGPLAAQAPVSGVVRDGATGHPLAGAIVAIDRIRLSVTSDADGRFRFVAPRGDLLLEARKLGYQAEYRLLQVVVGDTIALDLVLLPRSNELPELTTTASADRWRAGFERRMKVGLGQFIIDEELRLAENRDLASLVRTRGRGVRVDFEQGRAVLRGRGRCAVAVLQDGLPIYRPGGIGETDQPPDLNQWPVRQLRGVEIYGNAVERPLEFALAGGECGLLVLWTRAA